MTLLKTAINLTTDPAKNNFNSDAPDMTEQTEVFIMSSNIAPQHMSVATLVDLSLEEMYKYRQGKPFNDQFALELFRRALRERDPLAWEAIQQNFYGIVMRWLQGHPMRIAACRLDSEENYVAQTFARFWIATVNNPNLAFRSLAAVLQYLRACLNGLILDTLRTYSRSQEITLPESDALEELAVDDGDDADELWEVIKSLLPDERQQRVAYLLFYCNLKPREIIRYLPQEFSNIHVIYRLRRNIIDRLTRAGDVFRYRLNTEGERDN